MNSVIKRIKELNTQDPDLTIEEIIYNVVGKVKEVAAGVYQVGNKYIRIQYWYSSYTDTLYINTVEEVRPVERTIVVYE